MVRGHVLDSFAPKDARPAERAAIQQHQGESQVIACSGDAAAAAAIESVRLGAIAHALRLSRERIAWQSLREAMDFVRWHHEAGIIHVERFKNALLEERA